MDERLDLFVKERDLGQDSVLLNDKIKNIQYEYNLQHTTASNNNDHEKIDTINLKFNESYYDTYRSFGFIDEYNKLSIDNQKLLDKKLEPIDEKIFRFMDLFYI